MFDQYQADDPGNSLSQFVDKRLESRYEQIKELLQTGQSSIINEVSRNRAERKGSYDFFQNDRVSEQCLKERIYDNIRYDQIQGSDLLVVQDTSEYNFAHNVNRLRSSEGLSGLSNEHSLGYMTHASLVMRQTDHSILGLSDLQLWHRREDRPGASTRKQRDFEDKESYKWYVGMLNSQSRLKGANRITYIQDRDGDIYESIAQVKQMDRAELLVRSCRDRKIELKNGDQVMLYNHLRQQGQLFSYRLKIRGDKRKNRSSREAQLEVRCVRVNLLCPQSLRHKAPANVEVDVVWVKENLASVPGGESPVDWKLITTHQVEGNTDLIYQLVQWYASRWRVEDFFFVTKTGAYDLENALLETGRGLRKLGIMIMESAVKIMQLKQARNGTDMPTSVVFTPQEEEYLERILPSLEGRTDKQKNPYPKGNLARAAWIIARLGGWKGYSTSRPPGSKTLKRGLDKFETMAWAWNIDSG